MTAITAQPLIAERVARPEPRRSSFDAPFEFEEVTIAQLQDGMQRGRYSAHSVTSAYLERIEELDRSGPKLRSIIEVNPDALSIARQLDAERKSKGPRGPLHGVPVILKDIVDTADRMRTSAGSLALADSVAVRDAFIVERLRAAGAIILGKANLSEWSNARSTNGTSGWSARGGLTRNPYVLDRSPSGSSSGSAVAVAANLVTLGIGAETDGSIICPSSANGLVGIKPTVGLWSRSGIIPISYSQDTPGPICRTVRDAAILLTALSGIDERDDTTEASRGHVPADFTTNLDRGGLKGVRLGILRRGYDKEDPRFDTLDNAVDALRDAGAIIVDPVEIPTLDDVEPYEVRVLLYEFKDAIADYLKSRGPDFQLRTLQDLIDFNKAHASEELEFFGQEWFEVANSTDGRASPDYQKMLYESRSLMRDQGVDRVLRDYTIDAIVTLTAPPAFPIDLVNGDHGQQTNTSLAAVAGYPSISLPAHDFYGLPIGISFIGAPWSEAALLRMAYAFEQATLYRRVPRFLSTLVIDR